MNRFMPFPFSQPVVNPKEPLIYSSMSRVAGQIRKIATRTAQVVAGTLTPSRTDTRAPDLTATRMGRGLAGELPRCVSCQGERPLTASHALHFIPPSRRRGHVGIDQRFPNGHINNSKKPGCCRAQCRQGVKCDATVPITQRRRTA